MNKYKVTLYVIGVLSMKSKVYENSISILYAPSMINLRNYMDKCSTFRLLLASWTRRHDSHRWVHCRQNPRFQCSRKTYRSRSSSTSLRSRRLLRLPLDVAALRKIGKVIPKNFRWSCICIFLEQLLPSTTTFFSLFKWKYFLYILLLLHRSCLK